MKLAVFAARVDSGRQIFEQSDVEFAAGETRVEHLRIHAREARPQSPRDHLTRERSRGQLPKREYRLETRTGQLAFAVLPHVAEMKISESYRVKAFHHGLRACLGHARFVILVGAGPRQPHHP